MVEEVADRDLYTAIDLAADRTGRSLRRTLAWGDGPVGHHDERRAHDWKVANSAEEAMPQAAGQHVVQEGDR